MNIPGFLPYRPSQVTWPSSATPDYGGDVGLIVHDGSFPYWVSMTSKTGDLPDELAEEFDALYAIAAKDMSPVRPDRFGGLAVYGHLVNGTFFGRFAIPWEVASGTRKMTGDLGMARATWMRILLNGGMLAEDYEGGLWIAPSRPVQTDSEFGRQHSRWTGHPVVTCQYASRNCPKVPTFGALLTDTFVPYSPTGKISMRATEDQMENLSL